MTMVFMGQPTAKRWMELLGICGKEFSSRIQILLDYIALFIQAMSASYISFDSNLMLKQATGLKWLLVEFVTTTMISLITSE